MRVEHQNFTDALAAARPSDPWLLSHRDYYHAHGSNDAIQRRAERAFANGLRAVMHWVVPDSATRGQLVAIIGEERPS